MGFKKKTKPILKHQRRVYKKQLEKSCRIDNFVIFGCIILTFYFLQFMNI